MAIPQNLTREHVLQAIAYLKDHGVPKNTASTKYDIVNPQGNKWPPKRPALHYHGPSFSGGAETNSRLEDLGLEITLKPGLAQSAMTLEDLRPGVIITDDDIVRIFGVGKLGRKPTKRSRNGPAPKTPRPGSTIRKRAG